MLRKLITAVGVLAVTGAALLLTPETSLAQRRGGGGRGGSSGGRGWDRGREGDRGSSFWWGLGTGLAVSPYAYGGYGGYYGGYYSPYNRGYYGAYSSPYYYSDLGTYYSAPAYSSFSTPYYGDSGAYSSSSAYTPSANAADDRAHVMIRLPNDRAEVWIEGQKTTQDKPVQEYASPPLEQGKKFFYEIRARWNDRDGRTKDETRTFPIRAGDSVMVDFGRPAPADQKVISPTNANSIREGNSEDRKSRDRDSRDKNTRDRVPQDR